MPTIGECTQQWQVPFQVSTFNTHKILTLTWVKTVIQFSIIILGPKLCYNFDVIDYE